MDAPKLPRKIESEERAAHLGAELVARGRPLWPGTDLEIAQVEVFPALEAALASAFAAGRLVRGLEDAQRALAAEERGLANVDRKTGVARGGRVSRLLVLADDGAERFYRNVESLLRRHDPRVLALRLPVDERQLGAMIFGAGQVARLLLVEHKDAVGNVLRALAEQWKPNDASDS